MKKSKDEVAEISPEYDFSAGVVGKYAARFDKDSNVVLLDADVAEMFPNSASVNRALRALASIVKESSRRAS